MPLHPLTKAYFSVQKMGSTTFRDMADFAVLVLVQKDDPFGHPRFSYLPDGDLTSVVLDFDVTWEGMQSWESIKSGWTDWNTLTTTWRRPTRRVSKVPEGGSLQSREGRGCNRPPGRFYRNSRVV